MKNLLIALFVIFQAILLAQTCPPTNFVFERQSQVDSFIILYPNCTELDRLCIGNCHHTGPTSDIVNLDSLKNIETINIQLSIQNQDQIQSISGLSQLVEMDGVIEIRNCDRLKSLSGLGNIEVLRNGIFLVGNDSLGTLDHFPAVESTGTITLIDNRSLFDVSGLSSVDSVLGDFHFSSNRLITDLSVFDSIEYIHNALYLRSDSINSNAPSFKGLKHVEFLTIENNPNLLLLDAFSNLEYAGNISIESNPRLKQIDGFNMLTQFWGLTIDNDSMSILNSFNQVTSAGFITFISNPELNQINAFAQLTKMTGDLTVLSCPKLSSFGHLANIDTIMGRFSIGSTNFENFEEFTNLNYVGQEISISSNPRLYSLKGLYGIDTTGINNQFAGFDLSIISNPILSFCASDWLCGMIQSGNKDIRILSNDIGCQDTTDVILSCPYSCPSNINLQTQNKVDYFKSFYPNCDTIYGDLVISGTVKNLDSLIGIRHIVGQLLIQNTDSLFSLSGLDSLHYVGGQLLIGYNQNLTQIDQLNSLEQTGGNIDIHFNAMLQNLDGLNNLIEIDGGIWVWSNSNLISILGLKNVDPASIVNTILFGFDLVIFGNLNLSFCNIESICDFMDITGITTNIHTNGIGCNSEAEVVANCDGCGVIGIYTQSQLDDFPELFPTCDTMTGVLVLDRGIDPVENLDSLIQLVHVRNYLQLNSLGHLSDSEGLNNVKSVDGGFTVSGCDSITSLSGLTSLKSVGELSIQLNQGLTSLDGLDSLKSINGVLVVSQNPELSDIDALANINPDSLQAYFVGSAAVYIYTNPSLSDCSIQSLCDYLQLPDAFVNISNNANGCNTINQIEYHCGNTTCLKPLFNATTTNLDCVISTYETYVSVTILGSTPSGMMDILNSTNTYQVSNIDTGEYVIGPFDPSPNSSVTIYVRDATDTTCLDSIVVHTGLCAEFNDLACYAQEIEVDDDPLLTNNFNAGVEVDEPVGDCWPPGGNSAISSVWFYFVAPGSGRVVVTTDFPNQSLHDTRIAVYQASNCTNFATMTEIGCDEDGGFEAPFGYTSIDTIENIIRDSIYYIQVDGWANQTGEFLLDVIDLNPECMVLNCDDDGFGSLRAAVACASEGDTIQFALDIINDTITSQGLPVVIDKDLIIDLDPTRNIYLSGENLLKTIEVAPNVVVIIRGLNLIASPSGQEVAIDNHGELELIDVGMYPFSPAHGVEVLNDGTILFSGESSMGDN